MPPRQPPSRPSRKRLGPSDGDTAMTRRLLAARTRQARPAQGSAGPVRAEATEIAETPVAETPVAETPVAETPVVEETAASGSVAAEPVRPEPVRPEPVEGEGETRGGLPRLAIVLAVATVVLGCLAAWFGAEAGNASSGADTQNTALTDSSGTAMVSGEIATEVGTLFSYNYIDPAPTLNAASHDLTGSAISTYATLFARVRQLAPTDHLIVSFSVTSVGVEMLNGPTARLLVFGSESDRTASQAAGTPSSAMLAVNAVQAGGHWKISGINPAG
jgi:Mce-associated membrane protein